MLDFQTVKGNSKNGGLNMKNDEFFEVFVKGAWQKVVLLGELKSLSINSLWLRLQKEYGFENVRLTRDLTNKGGRYGN